MKYLNSVLIIGSFYILYKKIQTLLEKLEKKRANEETEKSMLKQEIEKAKKIQQPYDNEEEHINNLLFNLDKDCRKIFYQ